MSEPHVINLSTAWEPPSDGARAWIRRFGCPTGIEPGDRVWLVLEQGDRATLVLNGAGLPVASHRHDVTELLEPRNELLLIPSTIPSADAVAVDARLSFPMSHGRQDLDRRFGLVRLEIEAARS